MSSVIMGRYHLLVSLLAASSLLVAESLAIHQSPLQTRKCATSRCGRRRTPSWRLNDNNSIRSVTPSLLSTSSHRDDDGIVDAINHDHKDVSIENTSSRSTNKGRGSDEILSMWPQNDDLDKRMIKIALPCIANFAINPLIGAVDLFWVNRMGNALAVAGQAAANQVFSSAFWIVSVLPSGEYNLF